MLSTMGREAQMVKIGILSKDEQFSYDLLNSLNHLGASNNVSAVFVTPKAIENSAKNDFRLIIDRKTYLDKFMRTWIKKQALEGTYIISNPFAHSCDDKFFEYCLATKLNVNVPKTVCLPSHFPIYDFGDLIEYPQLDKVLEYTGLPAIVKPYDGWAWRDVRKVRSVEDLKRVYEDSMDMVLVVQEYIDYDHYVRAYVVGKEHVLPIKYEPKERRYILDHEHLSPEVGLEILNSCRVLNYALDYDFNTVEFAIKNGKAYAIDFWNTVPEVRPDTLPKEYYDWVVDKVTNVALELALNPLAKNRVPYDFCALETVSKIQARTQEIPSIQQVEKTNGTQSLSERNAKEINDMEIKEEKKIEKPIVN